MSNNLMSTLSNCVYPSTVQSMFSLSPFCIILHSINFKTSNRKNIDFNFIVIRSLNHSLYVCSFSQETCWKIVRQKKKKKKWMDPLCVLRDTHKTESKSSVIHKIYQKKKRENAKWKGLFCEIYHPPFHMIFNNKLSCEKKNWFVHILRRWTL